MTLDPAAYLLMARGHLLKATELIRKDYKTPLGYDAGYWVTEAILHTRTAESLLRQEKEEPCKL